MTRTGPGEGGGLGGGVGLGSWGWDFSFLCFGIVECAHGHAYAKQVRIMCVLSVPLLDQVQGRTKNDDIVLKSRISSQIFRGLIL